jgi:VWFA-related protein
VRLLATRPPGRRRVLLVISETRDRSSKMPLEEAVTLAQTENVLVYCVTYSAFLTPFTAKAGTAPRAGPLDLIGVFREIGRLGKTNTAEALASYTGGARFGFLKQRALEKAIARIGEELHSQYFLSFSVPEDAPPEYHAIDVQVRGRPELTVRTRPGYWPAAP